MSQYVEIKWINKIFNIYFFYIYNLINKVNFNGVLESSIVNERSDANDGAGWRELDEEPEPGQVQAAVQEQSRAEGAASSLNPGR